MFWLYEEVQDTGGLSRHFQARHSQNPMVLSEENVNILYEEAKNSLLNDGNYKEDVTEEVSASICNIVLLHENIITLHNDLLENGNMEQFLSKFYGYIVRNANVYFETVIKST